MSTEKPVVDLYEFDGLGIIVFFPSGVFFTNQVGGLSCFHPEAEGVFVPLSIGHKKIFSALQQHFTGDWHPIGGKSAEIIDKLLRSDGFDFIKVDKTKLSESVEGWIYIEIEKSPERFPLLSGFGKAKGVLTWENSD